MTTATEMPDRDPLPALALWLVLALSVYRLLVLYFGDIPADLEETYYLSWTDRLDFGFYSKPPLLAAVLAAVTRVFGESLFVLKSIALGMYTATALVIFALARELYDARIAALAALVFQGMPMTGVLSLFISTDAPLLLFWSLTLYGFVRAMHSEQMHWWLFTGVTAGLGLLSKYTMGVLAVGLLLFLLTGPRGSLLRTSGPWAALLVATLVWLPNLIWLVQHDFITLTHTRQISGLDSSVPSFGDLAIFLASQFIVFGPGMAIGLVLWIGRRTVWASEANRLLLLASLPMLLIVCLQAYLARANINWAAPAYVGLGIVATAYMLKHARVWLIGSIILNVLSLSILYHCHALAMTTGIELGRRSDPYASRLGWRELGEQLRDVRRRYPDAALLSQDRTLLARLGYHATLYGRRPALRIWNPRRIWSNQYDLYNDVADHPDGEFLLVSESEVGEEMLRHFAQAESLGMLKVEVYTDLQRWIHVYHVQDFTGYRLGSQQDSHTPPSSFAIGRPLTNG